MGSQPASSTGTVFQFWCYCLRYKTLMHACRRGTWKAGQPCRSCVKNPDLRRTLTVRVHETHHCFVCPPSCESLNHMVPPRESKFDLNIGSIFFKKGLSYTLPTPQNCCIWPAKLSGLNCAPLVVRAWWHRPFGQFGDLTFETSPPQSRQLGLQQILTLRWVTIIDSTSDSAR
jgi:hypothetical protein